MNFSFGTLRTRIGGPRAILILTLAVAGCGQDQIQVYRVPKEKDLEMPTSGAMAGGEQAPAFNPQAKLTWTLPVGWKELGPDAANMRAASFSVPGKSGQDADVGIIPLPPIGGREVQMVNIWRDKLKLPPADESSLDKELVTVAIGPKQGKLLDLSSTEPIWEDKFPERILVAYLTDGGSSWFFKMTGESTMVAENKQVFVDFLKSINFQASQPAMADPHAGMSMPSGARPAVSGGTIPSGDDSLPTWTPPANWQTAPPGQMLKAKFVAGTGEAKAEINIGAAGGAPLMNVNRWRGQLKLDPVDGPGFAKLVTPLDAGGKSAMLVDLTGTDSRTGQPARMVGVIVPQDGQSWFYKLMGNSAVVEQEKAAFLKFVQTVKYP